MGGGGGGGDDEGQALAVLAFGILAVLAYIMLHVRRNLGCTAAARTLYQDTYNNQVQMRRQFAMEVMILVPRGPPTRHTRTTSITLSGYLLVVLFVAVQVGLAQATTGCEAGKYSATAGAFIFLYTHLISPACTASCLRFGLLAWYI